ncbi:hypothetical protein [Streptomyces scopuliridis]|uniref:Uncharacterized protein n=1 Tax=Streptomyces scopuliridis RB72 TaxID=1440053 RepID=A0A2T7T404_9ACTN|nr:hypothetical protein [Streptomyces scopuliridis]PVE09859.1 hypothetical protein Y717_31455 [Streptomyces scopuliridis RB72]
MAFDLFRREGFSERHGRRPALAWARAERDGSSGPATVGRMVRADVALDCLSIAPATQRCRVLPRKSSPVMPAEPVIGNRTITRQDLIKSIKGFMLA